MRPPDGRSRARAYAATGRPAAEPRECVASTLSRALKCRQARCTITFQATDPTTNQPIGSPNTPVNCTNTGLAPIIGGVNTLLLSASTIAVPDMIALAATGPPNDGIVSVPGPTGTGAFAVAVANVGVAGTITVSADTGDEVLPVSVFVCETNPTTGECSGPLAPSVTRLMNPAETPTFAVFVRGSGSVPFNPGKNRVFVRLKEDVPCGTTPGAVTRGSTSVAVQTQ